MQIASWKYIKIKTWVGIKNFFHYRYLPLAHSLSWGGHRFVSPLSRLARWLSESWRVARGQDPSTWSRKTGSEKYSHLEQWRGAGGPILWGGRRRNYSITVASYCRLRLHNSGAEIIFLMNTGMLVNTVIIQDACKLISTITEKYFLWYLTIVSITFIGQFLYCHMKFFPFF